MGKRSAVVELFLGDMGSMQRELRPSIQREDQPTMETKLGQIAVKAVNQLPKSVVREIRTPRSVGAGGGQLPPATRWMWKRSHGGTTKAPPDERGGNRYVLPNATAPHLDSTKLRSLSAQLGSPLCPQQRASSARPVRSERCHVWTAPGWQELFSHFAALVGAAMCSAF
jgi:hypothetical protein